MNLLGFLLNKVTLTYVYRLETGVILLKTGLKSEKWQENFQLLSKSTYL